MKNIQIYSKLKDNNIYCVQAVVLILFYNLFIGLFHKAIMQSGCMFNPWALPGKHKERALNFAKKLGCQEEDPKKIVQYLRNVPDFDLVEAIVLEVGNLQYGEFLFIILVMYREKNIL